MADGGEKDDYRAEDDLHTLHRAHKIREDGKRMEAVHRHVAGLRKAIKRKRSRGGRGVRA